MALPSIPYSTPTQNDVHRLNAALLKLQPSIMHMRRHLDLLGEAGAPARRLKRGAPSTVRAEREARSLHQDAVTVTVASESDGQLLAFV